MKNPFQNLLFKQIEMQLLPHQILVEEVRSVLGMSKDRAYRRLNGTTELSLTETRSLCVHFGLSFDKLSQNQTETLSFYRDRESLFGDIGNINAGFAHLFEALERLNNVKDREIVYFCMEIPVFHIIQVPELLGFKMYYWNCIESDDIAFHESFSINADSKESSDIINHVINLYIRIPSTEILFRDAISSTLMQIMYFLESGKFENTSDALFLFDKLHELIHHIKLQAFLGRKFRFGGNPPEKGPKDNFQLFHNEMIHSQNTAYTRADNQESVYLECNVLSFLRTDDFKFCRRTLAMLEKIKSKSTLISSVSERERDKFFNRLDNDIALAKKKAKGLIDGLT